MNLRSHAGTGLLMTAPASAVEAPVDAPLPELLRGSEPGHALLTAPHSEMAAATPGATVGSPVEAPRGNGLDGLPDLTLPRVGLLAPTLSGALDSRLGLAPEGH
ncbi:MULTISPECIES: hypothetical protein [unclassified Streptomyces]|uniref:hypothetical protein n=1 Tax=unclassified Streptomyces TaxID=2593676 RepID=UPI0035D6C1F2